MKSIVVNTLAIVLFALFMQSCTAYKRVPYLKKAETLSHEQLRNTADVYVAKIMPKDMLSISITSETPGAAADFNLSFPYKAANSSTSESFTARTENVYIVDADGYIHFPVLGRLKLSGLTKGDAELLIYSQIYPDYLKEKPLVDIRFVNFSVTVLGEVANPGIYKFENEQMTILDALAAAGDMTIHGVRTNVLRLRTLENGEIVPTRINLQDKSILLNKDLYYLQQNDKIYVETTRTKANSRSFGSVESTLLSLLSVIISLGSLYYQMNRTK